MKYAVLLFGKGMMSVTVEADDEAEAEEKARRLFGEEDVVTVHHVGRLISHQPDTEP